MSRPIVGVLIAAAISLSAGAQGRPGDSDRIPVLAELFTSEGCNSCPPADRLLEMLSLEQPVDGAYVVALSEHVTYWDHQGWKDPFGAARFTERQHMYAYRFQLDGAFTPQLVVDGAAQLVGSDAEKVRRAIADAVRAPKPRLAVSAAYGEPDALSATVSGPGLEAGAAEGADVLWAVTEDNLVVDVKRGENAKKSLRHSGVVRNLTSRKVDSAGVHLRAERFGGQASISATMRLRPDWKRENLRLVAFVQSTRTRRVLSVGWTRLPTAD